MKRDIFETDEFRFYYESRSRIIMMKRERICFGIPDSRQTRTKTRWLIEWLTRKGLNIIAQEVQGCQNL